MKNLLMTFSLVLSATILTSCGVASIVAVPVKIAGKAATTTMGVAGKATEGAIGIVTPSGDDD